SPNAKDEGKAREAGRRPGMAPPVLVDSGHRIWRQYGVHAWPTLVLVDPLGRIVGQASGEPDEEPLESVVVRILEAARQSGVALNTSPLPIKPEKPAHGSLAYPGKVVASGDRLY